MSEEVQIAVYSEIHEADIARGLLEANGIVCRLIRDDAGAMYPQLRQALGVRLMVPEEFARQAQSVLEEAQADAAGKDIEQQ